MGAWKSSFSPESRGYSGRIMLEVHCGKAAGVAVVLDIVLGPVKIAPVAVPAPAVGVVVAGAWSSIYGAVAFSGSYGLGSWMYQW